MIDIDSVFISKDKFPVSSDILLKHNIYMHKRRIQRNLEKCFKQDIDFIKTIGKSNGGRNPDEYFMTIDCFRDICTMSQTELGYSIRNYIINAKI